MRLVQDKSRPTRDRRGEANSVDSWSLEARDGSIIEYRVESETLDKRFRDNQSSSYKSDRGSTRSSAYDSVDSYYSRNSGYPRGLFSRDSRSAVSSSNYSYYSTDSGYTSSRQDYGSEDPGSLYSMPRPSMKHRRTSNCDYRRDEYYDDDYDSYDSLSRDSREYRRRKHRNWHHDDYSMDSSSRDAERRRPRNDSYRVGSSSRDAERRRPRNDDYYMGGSSRDAEYRRPRKDDYALNSSPRDAERRRPRNDRPRDNDVPVPRMNSLITDFSDSSSSNSSTVRRAKSFRMPSSSWSTTSSSEKSYGRSGPRPRSVLPPVSENDVADATLAATNLVKVLESQGCTVNRDGYVESVGSSTLDCDERYILRGGSSSVFDGIDGIERYLNAEEQIVRMVSPESGVTQEVNLVSRDVPSNLNPVIPAGPTMSTMDTTKSGDKYVNVKAHVTRGKVKANISNKVNGTHHTTVEKAPNVFTDPPTENRVAWTGNQEQVAPPPNKMGWSIPELVTKQDGINETISDLSSYNNLSFHSSLATLPGVKQNDHIARAVEQFFVACRMAMFKPDQNQK